MAFRDIKYLIFHGKLYQIVADRLQLLLVDTLCRLSHLLGGLKITLSNWFYFSFAVAFSQQATEQAQTAPTSTLPPTMIPSLLPRQPYWVWLNGDALAKFCKWPRTSNLTTRYQVELQFRASLPYNHVLPRPQTSVANSHLHSHSTISSASSSFVESKRVLNRLATFGPLAK
jgi:hypothetical protein